MQKCGVSKEDLVVNYERLTLIVIHEDSSLNARVAATLGEEVIASSGRGKLIHIVKK
jgi:hypothetical protein